jgi:geranylgeranyl pyrophosphate synthase
MLISHETLALLAETSDIASEVMDEWGNVPGIAFRVTPDYTDLHISVVDAPC